jgi:hypothetical protein
MALGPGGVGLLILGLSASVIFLPLTGCAACPRILAGDGSGGPPWAGGPETR